MRLPSWSTLFAVAGGSGMGLGGMMMLLNKQRDQLANQAAFINSAVNIMKEQQTVRDLLGDDIQVGRASFNDDWSTITKTQVQLRVPVKGDRDSAYLYAYARREGLKEKLQLYKVEATFGKIAGKKLVIMDRTNEANNSSAPEDEQDPAEAPPTNDRKPPRRKTKQERREEMKNWKY